MRLFYLLVTLITSSVLFGAAEPSWAWLADFQYRKTITITENSGSALTDYQVRTEVSYESEMQSDNSIVLWTLILIISTTAILLARKLYSPV